MKNWLITLAVLMLLSGAVGGVAYVCLRQDAPTDGLAWLRAEFSPEAGVLDRIREKHAVQAVLCEKHCADIRAQRLLLQGMREANTDAAILSAAEAELARLDAECRASVRAHLESVAALLGATSGQRYLDIVLPRMAAFDHQGAPGLGMETECAHDCPHGR